MGIYTSKTDGKSYFSYNWVSFQEFKFIVPWWPDNFLNSFLILLATVAGLVFLCSSFFEERYTQIVHSRRLGIMY